MKLLNEEHFQIGIQSIGFQFKEPVGFFGMSCTLMHIFTPIVLHSLSVMNGGHHNGYYQQLAGGFKREILLLPLQPPEASAPPQGPPLPQGPPPSYQTTAAPPPGYSQQPPPQQPVTQVLIQPATQVSGHHTITTAVRVAYSDSGAETEGRELLVMYVYNVG